jgi:2,3-dihydroxy-2,3-dihydrophenylpropionate dehydrogenase
LEGKRALVVGAGSGIGRAVCDAYAAEGARVGTLERDAAKCEELATSAAVAEVVHGDATTVEANARAVRAMTDRFGGLDVLVSCVGVFDFYRGLGDLAVDDIGPAFDEMFATNVLSLLLSVKAAVQVMGEGASVVLTGSTSSFRPGRGGVLYVASKFAVRGLVVSLARELAPAIRVNGVAPGGTVGTDLRGAAALGQSDRRLDDEGDRAASLRERTPLQVALTPADHAWAYVYLASDRSLGVTGTFVPSDGGASVT